MKKLLFAIVLAAGLIAASPRAEAGQFARVYTRHGVTYVPKAYLYSNYGSSYGSRSSKHRHHNRHHSSYRYRPTYASYRPSYRTSYYRSSSCSSYSRPRFSISFGF